MRTRTRLSLHPEMKSRTLLSVTVSTILYGSLRRMNSSTLTVLNCLSLGKQAHMTSSLLSASKVSPPFLFSNCEFHSTYVT